MDVVIKTEGGKGIGFGHLTRCLSLIQAFEEVGVHPDLWIKGDENIKAMLPMLTARIDSFEPSSPFWKRIQGSDVAVIDSYLDNPETYQAISETSKVAVYLDDNNRIEYPKGVVLNGAVHASEINYPKKKQLSFLIGSQFILLRKSFWDASPVVLRPEITSVLITFGGEDPKNMTSPILKMLGKKFPKLLKRVVVGAAYKNNRQIIKCSDPRTELLEDLDGEGMISAMKKSDVAISAGGQTLNELARLGLPTIIVKVADNQTQTSAGWCKAGLGVLAGHWNDRDLMDSIEKCLIKIKPREQREKMAKAGRFLSDGQGARRAVRQIMEWVSHGE